MIAQFGPLGSGVQVTTPLPQVRQDGVASESAQTLSAEAVEIANPAPPVERVQKADSAPERAMMPELVPPNPKAPAGPPPAFEASILDRARETAFTGQPELPTVPTVPEAPDAPEDVQVADEVQVADGDTDATPKAEEEVSYDVPPSRAERAAEQVTTVRRIETPYDTATVDVSR